MKKLLVLSMFIGLAGLLYGCGTTDEFDASKTISVYTRDTSSGTRDGFMNGIGFGDASGDDSLLVDGFATRDNTGIMQAMTVDEFGIGYVSLSSVNDTVKGLSFEGVEPTEANVINDTYGLKRPFNYITRAAGDYESDEMEQIANAFIAFLHSIDGSDVISDEGAIPLSSNYTWDSVASEHPICEADNSGLTLKFGGSDSIQKIAEALSAAFSPRCGNVQTENDHTGSSDGYKRTQGEEKDGVNGKHIGYASRPFRGDEVDLTSEDTRGQLAWDAIVAIVHLDNPVDNLTAEQLRKIYSGDITTWQEVLED